MKTVLIVEDEIVLQDVYKLILTASGYNVVVAHNGFVGLAELKKASPDIVLLDLFMPVMDGREFMRNVDMKDFPSTQIIINSNHSDNSVRKEMLEMGAVDYVLKSSMTPKNLVDLVNKLSTQKS